MPHIARSAAVLFFLLAPLLHAQPLTFGEAFPVANTRYGSTFADPMVESNGRDFFLFWQTPSNLRVTRVVEGEHRAGRHVLVNETSNRKAAVTWTGTHFLVVSTAKDGLVGQLLDANAEPAGGTFPIVTGPAHVGAVASNGTTVLVLYWDWENLKTIALTPGGTPTGIGSTIAAPGIGDGMVDVASNGNGFAAVVSADSVVQAITFDGEGRERSRSIPFTGGHPRVARQVAIGSNGRDYLAAWQLHAGAEVQAAHILANGSAGPQVLLEPPGTDGASASPLQVAWTGANWAVAYSKEDAGSNERLLRVAYIHATASRLVGHEDAGSGVRPSLAAANGRVLMTWRPGSAIPPVGALLPLAGQTPEPVAFAAASQQLLATASTSAGTFVVWNESVNGADTMRAGIRSPEGDWVEREIAAQRAFEALAATDGRDFVVVGRRNGGHFAIFVDANARVTKGPVALPLWPEAITWSGTDYVIASEFSMVRLSPGGTVSPMVPPEPTGEELTNLALASDGTRVMALVADFECNLLITCVQRVGRPRVAELGADLRPAGEPRLINPASSEVTAEAQLVWDGKRFVAAWVAGERVQVAEIPADGSEPAILASLEASFDARIHLAAVEGGVAITWRGQVAGLAWTRIALVRHDGSVRTAAVLDGDTPGFTEQSLVAALPNGGLAHLISTPRYAPPHHGSPRVTMRVAGAALPRKPEPPRLTGMVRNGRVELAWSAPPQDLAGYRLEYRIGDGSWNEVEQWLDEDDREATIAWQLRRGVPYQFRIRAFNDAGAGDYSATVLLNVSRRRAVR